MWLDMFDHCYIVDRVCPMCGLDSDGAKHCGQIIADFEGTKLSHINRCPKEGTENNSFEKIKLTVGKSKRNRRKTT